MCIYILMCKTKEYSEETVFGKTWSLTTVYYGDFKCSQK